MEPSFLGGFTKVAAVLNRHDKPSYIYANGLSRVLSYRVKNHSGCIYFSDLDYTILIIVRNPSLL